MIRYLYGPWDPKYRNYLNVLIARDLIRVNKIEGTYIINLTTKGCEISNELLTVKELEDYKFRSELLLKKFKKFSSTQIKNYIYKIFPEITTMKLGDVITYEY